MASIKSFTKLVPKKAPHITIHLENPNIAFLFNKLNKYIVRDYNIVINNMADKYRPYITKFDETNKRYKRNVWTINSFQNIICK